MVYHKTGGLDRYLAFVNVYTYGILLCKLRERILNSNSEFLFLTNVLFSFFFSDFRQ